MSLVLTHPPAGIVNFDRKRTCFGERLIEIFRSRPKSIAIANPIDGSANIGLSRISVYIVDIAAVSILRFLAGDCVRAYRKRTCFGERSIEIVRGRPKRIAIANPVHRSA